MWAARDLGAQACGLALDMCSQVFPRCPKLAVTFSFSLGLQASSPEDPGSHCHTTHSQALVRCSALPSQALHTPPRDQGIFSEDMVAGLTPTWSSNSALCSCSARGLKPSHVLCTPSQRHPWPR